ncbi:thiamine ABC transporter permease [Mesotoga sp. Brook.08.YT.4.2.5.1]|jgi:ATP-binding cassette subfamily B protein|uniref:ABC transporter ATP-binding protein n=1 Tax=unclassified Mesotoga TaxID=1184398 RepID=UPI000C19A6AB|nr:MULTISPECIES: ABC transporter ATP-binding protein [unclassified Mesotoga]PNQ05180.1 thiamine ABC transporter permease [Mesotoga sp. SC_NapDC3]PXF34186.1 thiamine ABC transporter permease [Mesotoga sp. SC_NapDC]RIZ61124.1 thiamine ABC transporter permease [Mesotoga sp. SC_NapDC2]MDD3460598.1 ABC transporter ATP-binding protein [Mesotoga sp.]PNE22378.1 thiamine ABC transporter permease [Mesotoga sp. Brook.08.YT.4.2.5.1]
MIRKFIAYYRPHLRLFILDMACAFMIAGIDLVFPRFTTLALDNYIPSGNMRGIVIISVIMAMLFILRAVFNYIVNYWGHVVGVRMEYNMRKDIFSHLQTLSFSYFDKVRTGKIMSRIVNDLREITELAHHGPEDLFISVVTLVGAFVILMQNDWRLTLVVFAYIPFMIWYGIKKRQKMARAFRLVRKKIANVNAQLENSISGIRVAQSFTNEEFEKNKFDLGNQEFKESRQFAFKSMAEMTTGIDLMMNMLKVTVLALGGYLTYSGEITIGAFVAYFLYVDLFLQPIRRLMQFAQQYEDGMSGFERFVEIMETKSSITDSPDAIELTDVRGDVRVEGVSFAYDGGENVLKDISLHIPAGEMVALVGPSGGGKTTLCHLIPRFYDVNSGKITIDGIDIRNVTLHSLRSHIGIVQQDVFLFAGSIRDNIAYGKGDATDEEIVEAAKRANIHDFILSLENGYDSYVGERGVMLSGGQKQRISIARVFLKNPPLLILDEATSALDNETELKIQESLEALSKGRTTLVIAHRLSTIKNADEIVVITSDGIIERGSHDELLEKGGHYARLYRAQFKGYIPDM